MNSDQRFLSRAVVARFGREAGFSLAESLVSLALLGVLGLCLERHCRAVAVGQRIAQALADADAAVQFAVLMLVRDVRGAGFAPIAPIPAGLRRAAESAIEVGFDLNGDGDEDDAGERIGYELDSSGGRLMRALGGGSPQPMLDDVAPNGLTFRYFTARGEVPARGPGGLSPAQRAAVRRIEISVTIEARSLTPGAGRIPRSAAGTVALRNVP